jgi:hypothetical protein
LSCDRAEDICVTNDKTSVPFLIKASCKRQRVVQTHHRHLLQRQQWAMLQTQCTGLVTPHSLTSFSTQSGHGLREKKKHELKTKPLSHKTVHMNSLNAPFRLILASRGLSFSFVVYGLDLLVKVWFVFIVLALEVPGSKTKERVFFNRF